MKVVRGKYTAEEVKGIIGQCDLFIGGKLHACIDSLSQFIPTVGIPYAFKFQGIFKQLGQEEYICKNLSGVEISEKAKNAWINKDRIKQKLHENMPKVTGKAWLNAELVRELIEES